MPLVSIATAHGTMPAYVAEPGGNRSPGVVVVHDALGMTNDLRAQADWLAEAGYVAAAPDLFYWGKQITCIRTVIRDVRARHGRSFEEIDAVRDWLERADALHGPNRRDRLLHGRGVRTPPGAGAPLLRF